jgi:hypothetical protein
MSDSALAPVCGLYCGACPFYGEQCGGCGNIEGRPFWTSEVGIEVCVFYDCCLNEKGLEHCGLCEDLPCQTFLTFYDLSLSEEEAKQSIADRQAALRRRKGIGTERWLEEQPAGK